MMAELFQVQLLDFPLSTKKNHSKIIQNREVYIFPFHRHNHVLNLYGPLIKSNINCTCKMFDRTPDNIINVNN